MADEESSHTTQNYSEEYAEEDITAGVTNERVEASQLDNDIEESAPQDNVEDDDEIGGRKQKTSKTITVSTPAILPPGKSALPFSRVQKILKADRELPSIGKEAVFLISKATEDFIKRFAESVERVAAQGKRTTIQQRDIATAVHHIEEYSFLEELIPPPGSQPPPRRKPKALQNKNGEAAAPTLLDKFVANQDETQDEADESPAHVMMDEDGAMYAQPDT